MCCWYRKVNSSAFNYYEFVDYLFGYQFLSIYSVATYTQPKAQAAQAQPLLFIRDPKQLSIKDPWAASGDSNVICLVFNLFIFIETCRANGHKIHNIMRRLRINYIITAWMGQSLMVNVINVKQFLFAIAMHDA